MVFITSCAVQAPHIQKEAAPVVGLTPPPSVRPLALPGITHTVKKGDTLWSISKSYGVSLESLVETNRIPDDFRIRIGEKLLVPADGRSALARVSSAGVSKFIWPASGAVAAPFGTKREGVTNKGIVIRPPGPWEVVASQEGRVAFVDEKLRGYGRTIILEHAEEFSTVYAGMGEILVKPGQTIGQGEVVGRLGAEELSGPPELYFEIRRKLKTQNPLHYLP